MYRPGGFSGLPPVIKNLIILNAIFFLATFLFGAETMYGNLALFYPASPYFKPIQIVTHMFMHGGFMHFFFNMFALYMFGNELEYNWGPKRFLTYYLLCGFGAAALYYGVDAVRITMMNNEINQLSSSADPSAIMRVNELQGSINSILSTPVLGASGAVFGILLAFGVMFPNRMLLLLFPPIPIKAKYFVFFYGLMELYLGFQQYRGDNVAHFAHVGGMVVGIIILLIWKAQRKLYS